MKTSFNTGLDCVPPSEWTWLDCDIEGHEEGCFMAVCPACGTTDRDCEYR
jgi:hypothetical protein